MVTALSYRVLCDAILAAGAVSAAITIPSTPPFIVTYVCQLAIQGSNAKLTTRRGQIAGSSGGGDNEGKLNSQKQISRQK
jgi:hypothetical protein